jgi:hypothetical protein
VLTLLLRFAIEAAELMLLFFFFLSLAFVIKGDTSVKDFVTYVTKTAVFIVIVFAVIFTALTRSSESTQAFASKLFDLIINDNINFLPLLRAGLRWAGHILDLVIAMLIALRIVESIHKGK